MKAWTSEFEVTGKGRRKERRSLKPLRAFSLAVSDVLNFQVVCARGLNCINPFEFVCL